MIVLLGLTGLGFQQFFYFLALNYAPIAQVSVLNYMWPIFILALSMIILKQKFSWKHLSSLLLGFTGVVIVITEGKFLTFNPDYIYGYIFALGAAFAWALFSVLNKLKKIEPLKGIFLFNLVGLFFMFIVMFVSKSSFLISLKSIFGTVYLGAFPTAIAFLTWLKSLKIGNPVVIANLAHLTPFISLLFIYIILKEKILFSEIIGLIVIVSAIFLQWVKLKN